MISDITITMQYSFGATRQRSVIREMNRRHDRGKNKIRLSYLQMIQNVCLESPRESAEEL